MRIVLPLKMEREKKRFEERWMYTNLSCIDLFLFAVYNTFMEPSIPRSTLSYTLSKCLMF